jgi:uncharacterized protein
MELNIPLVLKAVLEDYALPLNGDHGVSHWARVLENGHRLAEETGASPVRFRYLSNLTLKGCN